MSKLLEVKSLQAYYHSRLGPDVRAVDGVSLSLNPAEVLGIAGESGCGKSTLANVLALNVQAPLHIKQGFVLVNGEDVFRIDARRVQQEIRGCTIALLPQGALNSLNPTARIDRFVVDVMREHYPGMSREEALDRARQRLESLGLSSRVLDLYPHQLSGGMKQRVVTVISTLLNPRILIADEPTSALDVTSQKAVIALMRRLLKEEIIESIVFITHDLPLLRHVADRIVMMYAGHLVEIGSMEEIIFSPRHPYTAALVESALVPEPYIRQGRVHGIGGAPPDLRQSIPGCPFAPRCSQAMAICRDSAPEAREHDGHRVWCWRTSEADGWKAAAVEG